MLVMKNIMRPSSPKLGHLKRQTLNDRLNSNQLKRNLSPNKIH